jgi:hypothetical protein
MDGIRLPVQDEGDLFPPAHPDRGGNDVGIPVFGEDHIRVKPLQEGVDLERHIGGQLGIDLQPVPLAFYNQAIPPSEGEQGISFYADLHGPKGRKGVLDLPRGTTRFYP